MIGTRMLSALCALAVLAAPASAGDVPGPAPAPAPDPAAAKNEAEAGQLLLRYLAAQRAYAAAEKKFAAGFAAGGDRPVARGDAGRARLAKLVAQLGNNDFAEREAASVEIGKLGPAALALLEEERGRSKDPEVSSRLDALVRKLRPAPGKAEPVQLLGTGEDLPWSKVERAFADAVTGGKPLAGYRFVCLEKDAAGRALAPRRHAIAAIPEEHGKTGSSTLLAWDDLDSKLVCGEVLVRDTAGKSPEALPVDAARDGWKPPATAEAGPFGAARARAFETNAVGSCRAYCAAQVMFHRNDWDADGVLEYAARFPLLATTPDGAGNAIQLLDKAFAQATTPRRPRHGYFFVEMTALFGDKIDWVNDHALCAVPAEYGRTGRLTLIICTDGTVFQKDTGGMPVFDYPKDPAADGWVVSE